MLFLLLLFHSLASALAAAHPQAPTSTLHTRQNTDAEVVASYARQGLCMYYIGTQRNRDQELSSCTTYCATQPDSDAVGCKGPTVATADLDPSTVYKDDAGDQYTPGECFCSAGLATALFQIVAEGLSELDNVLCAVMASALESVVEIGLDMTPEAWVEKAAKSGAEAAVKAAVKGAKSFQENGGDATDVMSSWIGKACDVPNWSFSIDDVFTNLVSAPEEWGTSIGCKKSKC